MLRFFKFFATTLLLGLFLNLSLQASVWADNSSENEANEPPPEKIWEFAAAAYGVAPDSPEIERIKRGEAYWNKEETERPVVKYIRGKNGVPLVQRGEDETPWGTKAEVEELIKANLEKQLEATKAAYDKVVKLPRCEISDTKKTLNKAAPQLKKFKGEVFNDMLLILPEDLPKDPQEAFGSTVYVLEYDQNKPSPAGYLGQDFGVTCLPTRIRSTAQAIYWHEGMDAILNYEGKADGKGQLHPYMEEWVRKF